MAVVTTNTELRTPDWHEAATGPGEFLIGASSSIEYAFAASTPSAALRGHTQPAGLDFAVELPDGTSLYVRPVSFKANASVFLVTTPGQ